MDRDASACNGERRISGGPPVLAVGVGGGGHHLRPSTVGGPGTCLSLPSPQAGDGPPSGLTVTKSHGLPLAQLFSLIIWVIRQTPSLGLEFWAGPVLNELCYFDKRFFSVTLRTILKSRSDRGMFLGRIFPLLWRMLLCLEATKGPLKMTDPKLQGHHIFFQQTVLENISVIKKKKTT